MPFDITTARPVVNTGKFDITTARPVVDKAQSAPEDQGIFSRIGTDINERVNRVIDPNADLPNYLISSARLGVGVPMDIGGEVLKSAAGYIPQGAKDYVSSLVPQGVKDYAGSVAEKLPEFEKKHPTFSNLAGLATELPIGAGVTKAAPVVAERAAVGGIDAAKAAGSAVRNSNIVTGVGARSGDALSDAIDAMRAKSSSTYQAAKNAGVIFNDNKTQGIISDINNAVSSAGILNQTRHADTLSALTDINNAAKKGPLSLEELDLHRQNLNEVINDNTDSVTGKMNSDAHRALLARNALDDAIKKSSHADIISGDPAAIELLGKARGQWSQSAKFQSVSNIINKAGGDPDKLKAGFARFLNNKKNLNGFSQEEIATLRAASRNTINERILKGLGRFGIDPGNVYLPGMGAIGGSLAGAAPQTAAVLGAGTVARQSRKYIARGKAEKALREIEK